MQGLRQTYDVTGLEGVSGHPDPLAIHVDVSSVQYIFGCTLGYAQGLGQEVHERLTVEFSGDAIVVGLQAHIFCSFRLHLNLIGVGARSQVQLTLVCE